MYSSSKVLGSCLGGCDRISNFFAKEKQRSLIPINLEADVVEPLQCDEQRRRILSDMSGSGKNLHIVSRTLARRERPCAG